MATALTGDAAPGCYPARVARMLAVGQTMRPMLRFAVAFAACLPIGAWATDTGDLTAEYTGYSHGLTVLKLAGSLSIGPGGYAIHVTFHTAGLIGMVVHSDNDSTATGRFANGVAHPIRFAGTGHLRGGARATEIDYDGGNPVVKVIVPPVEQERGVVAPADTQTTIDTLSAVALLIHQVGESGTCGGKIRTFDGRRLAEQRAYAAGSETLPKTDRSIFEGAALRCNFEGRQLAGFVRDENEDRLRKPRYGAAWFANVVAGAPPVPVKVEFDNKILGQVTLYLTAVHGGPDNAVAQCCSGQLSKTP